MSLPLLHVLTPSLTPSSGEILNCVGMIHDNDLTTATHEGPSPPPNPPSPPLTPPPDWHAQVDKSHLLRSFSDLHPSLLAVLAKASDVKRWPLLYRAPVESWTKGNMVIIGDAAHPMLPHQGQGGAQGIEDGISLGVALSGAGVTAAQVAERLAVFEKARRHRASAIQVMSNAGQEQWDLVHDEVAQYVENVPSKFLFLVLLCWWTRADAGNQKPPGNLRRSTGAMTLSSGRLISSRRWIRSMRCQRVSSREIPLCRRSPRGRLEGLVVGL